MVKREKAKKTDIEALKSTFSKLVNAKGNALTEAQERAAEKIRVLCELKDQIVILYNKGYGCGVIARDITASGFKVSSRSVREFLIKEGVIIKESVDPLESSLYPINVKAEMEKKNP